MGHRKITRALITKKLGVFLNTTKYILIASCAILFIFGIALFGLGISTCVSQKAVTMLNIPGITSLPPLMIVLGLFICITSAFGGLGSYLYKRSFLLVFAVILGILLLGEFCVGISAGAASESTIDKLTSGAWASSTNDTISYFEARYNCCGFFDATDKTVHCANLTFAVPSSSSGLLSSSAITGVSSFSASEGISGCRDAIFGVVKGMTSKITVGAFVILLFQGAVLFVTVLLSLRIKKINTKYSSITQFDDGDDEIEVGLGSSGDSEDVDLSLGEFEDDKSGKSKIDSDDDDDYVNDPNSLLE